MKRIGFLSLFVLAGCSPLGAVVGAGATVGVGAAQERGLSAAFSDTEIQTSINARWAGESLGMFNQLGTMVHEGRVLVTGRVTEETMRARALELAAAVPGVVVVIDEIQVASSGRTIDYGRDLWIIGQLRSKFTFDGNVQAVNYAIDSVGGTVYLMGVAQSQAELERVTAHARNQAYVRRVVSHVRIKDASPPAVSSPAPAPERPQSAPPTPSNRRDPVAVTPL